MVLHDNYTNVIAIEGVAKETDEQIINKILYEEELRKRKLEALNIARRALRYITGYLTDYTIETSQEVTKDYVRIEAKIYFKPPEGMEG